MMKSSVITGLCVVLLSLQGVYSQSVFGRWKTIDDRTGKPKAVVELYRQNGELFGKVVEILEEGKEDARCVKCKGARKDKPVLGMEIIEGLRKIGENEWKGSTLFDPEQAMTFRCRIWLHPKDPDKLLVRGYLALFYRTQTWLRVEQ